MIDTPRWRRRKSARPEEIVEAALEIFTARGYAAARLDEIAARAGVTKGTLYLYFDSKEALLRAVIAENLIPNIERLEATIDAAETPTPELMRNLLVTMAAALIKSNLGRLPKLIISEAANFPELVRDFYHSGLSRIFALHRKVLQRGIDRGEFRQVDIEATTRAIQAQILFLCIWQHALGPIINEPIDAERHLANAVDVLVNGLRRT